MLDGMMKAATGYFSNNALFYAVTAAIAHALWQVVTVGGFDVMLMVKFVASIVVATLLAHMIVGSSE